MQEDLFGNEIECENSREPRSARPPVNNMKTITEVLARAGSEFGYVVAGVARRVYRKTSKDNMKQVPVWEMDAVLQLVDGGQLKLGSGTRVLRNGAVQRPTTSVLVPKATKDLLTRWSALAQPSTWKG